MLTDLKPKYQLDQEDFEKLCEKHGVDVFKMVAILEDLGVEVAWGSRKEE